MAGPGSIRLIIGLASAITTTAAGGVLFSAVANKKEASPSDSSESKTAMPPNSALLHRSVQVKQPAMRNISAFRAYGCVTPHPETGSLLIKEAFDQLHRTIRCCANSKRSRSRNGDTGGHTAKTGSGKPAGECSCAGTCRSCSDACHSSYRTDRACNELFLVKQTIFSSQI